jgi:hypothetical protein
MACFRKCPNNNLALMCYTILQKDSLGCEYTKIYLFCSNECLEYFKQNYTTEDENGYEYFNEIVEMKYPICPTVIIDLVAEYKRCRKYLLSQLN